MIRHSAAALLALFLAAPVVAQPMMGGWGRPYGGMRELPRALGPAEGKVTVNRFVAAGSGAAALGRGPVSVVAAPDNDGASGRELATYEAAVVDQLAHTGYDTTNPNGGQVAELRIGHDVVVPEEAPHKPVSGEMDMGVSNRGSMMGMAIDVDLSKPKKALISTRLETRIRDKVTGAVLWEGRADIITREGDPRWSDQAIAAKLARALFDRFPGHSGETFSPDR